MASVGAVLLAAGLGQRMGRPKALLPWQGLPLVTYQIRTLRRAGLRPIAVVLGHRAVDISPHVDNEYGASMLLNPFYRKGKTTSLKTGLRGIDPNKADSALILNVDQPRSQETIESIINHHQRNASLITIPTYNRKRGHPVVVSLKLMAELMAVTEARQGLKAVMRTHAKEITLVEMDTNQVLLDLNTPEDYQSALKNHPHPS